MSHPSLIRDSLALFPSRLDSCSAVIRIVPPFMGLGGGVVLESVICYMSQDQSGTGIWPQPVVNPD